MTEKRASRQGDDRFLSEPVSGGGGGWPAAVWLEWLPLAVNSSLADIL